MISAIIKKSVDFRYVDVHFVTIPDDRADSAIILLNNKISDIQRLLNRRLRMRPVPKIRFHIDMSEQEATKLDKIIEKL